MKETIVFNWDKETQNAQRFTAPQGAGSISGSIYVPKEVAGERKELRITIEA